MDQNAFINNLKQKNLMDSTQRGKALDMLETVDLENESSGSYTNQKNEGAGSNESQDGGGRRSSSEKLDDEEEDGYRKGSFTSPEQRFEPEVDDVDSEGSKGAAGSPIEPMVKALVLDEDKNAYSEGESERIDDSSDDQHKNSEHTAYFHHASNQHNPSADYAQVKSETFSGVLYEQGFGNRSPESKFIDTFSSSNKGGFNFMRQHLNNTPAAADGN